MWVLANPYKEGGQGENSFYYRGQGFQVRMHAVRPVYSAKHVPADNGSGAAGPTVVSMPSVSRRYNSVCKEH